jgi:8-oxo-dGTP diphosphatase
MQNVTAAIITHDRKVLIAKRKANDQQAGKWEFPGGKIRKDETPQQCLAREMREEFGIEVMVGDFFAESIYHYEDQSIRLMAFHAVWTKGNISLNAHAEFRWVSVDQINKFDFAPADVPLVEKLQRNNTHF